MSTFQRRKELKKRKSASVKELNVASTSQCADVNLNLTAEGISQDDVNKSIQTDFTSNDIINLNLECQNLRNENFQLKQNLNTLDLKNFEGNNEKVKVYTGLQSYEVMVAIFSHIKPELSDRTLLKPFQQFLLTCMKLKLDLPMPYLGQIFSVHKSATVSRMFVDVLNIMNVSLVPLLLLWPSRESLMKTMPLVFHRNHRNCTCIVDCFEIFIEKPKDLKARALTYSNYKSHNTVKYLIAIAPNGMIIFISKGWGGRTSDKHVVEQCGIMDLLLPGDSIMVDRGFPITDVLALYRVSLFIPPFTRGKKQLSPDEVEQGRRISALRIHVERVIGLVRRKYAILQSTIPISLLYHNEEREFTTLDKIVRVSCAMCNTNGPIIPLD